MMEADPLEIGPQRLHIPAWWEVEAALMRARQQPRKPPHRKKKPTPMPENWKTTLAVFLPQR